MDAGRMTGDRPGEPSDNERRVMEDPSIIGRGLLLNAWLRTPLIAVVNGDCLGGGCEMLQQIDVRIAEEHARFGLPEARRGLMAGAGSTESAYAAKLMRSHDGKEGMAAFVEKRSPRFTGT